MSPARSPSAATRPRCRRAFAASRASRWSKPTSSATNRRWRRRSRRQTPSRRAPASLTARRSRAPNEQAAGKHRGHQPGRLRALHLSARRDGCGPSRRAAYLGRRAGRRADRQQWPHLPRHDEFAHAGELARLRQRGNPAGDLRPARQAPLCRHRRQLRRAGGGAGRDDCRTGARATVESHVRQRRLGGRRNGAQARQAVPDRQGRQAARLQGHLALERLSRLDDGRAVGHRLARHPACVRAGRPRHVA